MPHKNQNFSAEQPFSEYLAQFKRQLQHLFHTRIDIDKASTKRGIAPFVLREIMSTNPLATFVPQQFGGRGGIIREGLALASAASYESLPLSLGFGINWALFLQPLVKYAAEDEAQQVCHDFLSNRKMGGLMITEPDYGSDALHMQTGYSESDGLCHLQGSKHWAGLTGWADYWLLTARRKTSKGSLARDVDFFICDQNAPDQGIEVEEFYENLGIYLLPYGRNKIDVKIPASRRLIPKTTGIKMMLDLLHRSRMQFPGMAQGFVQRMLDEAVAHTRQRQVGGRSLYSYDQVQQRLARLQTAVTVTSALCYNSSQKTDIANDLSGLGFEANATKTFATDLMQESAQSLLQLVGAKGYRLDHIAGRAIVDSRPFQIFEGSNDILYIQLGEVLQKRLQRNKQSRLSDVLQQDQLTAAATKELGSLIDFDIRETLSQRKLHDLGRICSRVVAVNLVLNLGQAGYSQALTDQAIVNLKQEISSLCGAFSRSNDYGFLADKQANWLEL